MDELRRAHVAGIHGRELPAGLPAAVVDAQEKAKFWACLSLWFAWGWLLLAR